MKLHEITTTIQGELPNMGRVCTLVRLSGCNLNCFYCDTDHSCKFEMTPEEVLQKIDEINIREVLITGGEPLLQEEEVSKLFELMFERDREYKDDYSVVIETNGTLPVSGLYKWVGRTKIAMDLKPLPITTPQQFADSLKHIDQLYLGDVLKIIFWDNDSFEFGYKISEQIETRATIVFSPSWSLFGQEDMKPYIKMIKELQMQNPYKRFAFQLQLHKVLGVK